MRWSIFIALVGALVTLASPCEAALSLKLTSGVTTITIVDADDDGKVDFNGAVGAFGVTVSTGLSEPIETSPYPHLHLNVIANSSGAGTLTVELTETSVGSTFVSPLGSLSMDVGGITGGGAGSSTAFTSYVDDNDIAFGTGTTVNSLGPFGPGPYAASNSADVVPNATNPYSVTIVGVITHAGGGTSSFDVNLSLPEPATVAIWSAFSFVGLAYGALRRKRAA